MGDKSKDDQGKQAAWPAVEQQLRESKVTPGSALEKLIRENQDFEILAPEEANDGQPFPPWLRVWFRKKHPEVEFSGPRVGYPWLLKDIGLWMLRHQDLPENPAPGQPGGPNQGSPQQGRSPAPQPGGGPAPQPGQSPASGALAVGPESRPAAWPESRPATGR